MTTPEAAAPTTQQLTRPALNKGEIYVGTIISADGTRNHHIILLPGEATARSWQAAMEWAENLEGTLPDRVESALLFAHLKNEFRPDWYWTCEQHAANSDYAWYQHFDNGGQDYDHTLSKLRARAVRRSVI